MTEVNGDLEELARQVQQVITENRKFLDRIMDDEFDPEPTDEVDAAEYGEG